MLRVARLPDGRPEVFSTIQGEGVSAGRPSVFLRLALCNLHCSWCDTKYTWDWTTYDPKELILPIEASKIATAIAQYPPDNVVITGGEPLLQQEELLDLASTLRASGRTIEIETNGTIVPTVEFAELVSQWNVSPKLANSANSDRERRVDAALSWFAGSTNAWFKFVIAQPGDLREIADLEERYSIPRHRIVLMAEGTSATALRDRSRWLAELCADRGYRFTPRLHIWLWGDERGR